MLITAPQRWGKSLNLTMLKAFFQTDGDDITHYNENGRYDFSRGNKNSWIFRELKIEGKKHGAFSRTEAGEETKEVYYREYEGQYPVIYLNLKSVTGFKNLEEFQEKLRLAVSQAYKEHGYLYKKERIN